MVHEFNAGSSKKHHQLEEFQRNVEQLRTNPITHPGPIIEAFQRHRSFIQGPTIYGDTSIHESFAESYALFKLDPDALIRIDPKLYTWFTSNQHLAFNTGL
jgi:hypothetical protein